MYALTAPGSLVHVWGPLWEDLLAFITSELYGPTATFPGSVTVAQAQQLLQRLAGLDVQTGEHLEMAVEALPPAPGVGRPPPGAAAGRHARRAAAGAV